MSGSWGGNRLLRGAVPRARRCVFSGRFWLLCFAVFAGLAVYLPLEAFDGDAEYGLDEAVLRVASPHGDSNPSGASSGALEAAVGALQAESAALRADVTALRSSPVMALNAYLMVAPAPPPRAVFSGLNIQLVNGLGQTDSIKGLGNLVIGYDEKFSNPAWPLVCSEGSARTKPRARPTAVPEPRATRVAPTTLSSAPGTTTASTAASW